MARSTRESILTAAAELMRHRGFGALYHHFRGGKVQIAREALINAGHAYALLIPSIVDGYTDLGEAIEGVFTQAAEDMAGTGFANMCPVASVAAEVADTVEELRETSASVFQGWVDGGSAYFASRGLDASQAREVTLALIGALEGAFVLARTLRSTEPLLAAGRALGPQYRGVDLAPRGHDSTPATIATSHPSGGVRS